MTIRWFTDLYAKVAHARLQEHLKPMCAELFPDHLFTHAGFNRNETTGEVIIKLHLRPIGEAREILGRLDYEDRMRGQEERQRITNQEVHRD